MLLICTRERNPKLTDFSVEIGTLNAKRLRSLGHTPAVLVEDSRDIVALEPLTSVAQAARRANAVLLRSSCTAAGNSNASWRNSVPPRAAAMHLSAATDSRSPCARFSWGFKPG